MSDRKKPARWRKARNPYGRGRHDNPICHEVWRRDHGVVAAKVAAKAAAKAAALAEEAKSS